MNLIVHIAAVLQLLALFCCCISAQRVPPGVHPNHYQQQQQQQQFQQQPQYQQQHQQQQHHQQQNQQQQQQQQFQQQPQYQQQQQQPQFQQQVPVQQQQVPVQPQVQQGGQVPIQQQHPPVQQQVPHQHQQHHAHHQSGKILDTQHILEEKEHIAEHMDIPIDTSKMTEQELQFHYFKMHDADNNNKLDGCELIKSLIHWHEQGSKDPGMQNQIEDKVFKDDELITLIDPILNMDDNNHDGYIDYPEFIKAQQKVAQNKQ